MKYKVGLSAGHSNVPGRDQGATGNSYIEGHLAVEYRALLAFYLRKKGINPIMDGNNTILKETINFFKKVINAGDYILLDIHWNSGSSKSAGTETFIPENPKKEEIPLAKAFSKITSVVLDIPLRGDEGVKYEYESHHKKLGFFTLSDLKVLLEICFITNASEMESYQRNKNILAEKHAQLLFNFCNGLPLMNSINLDTNTKNYHVVQTGDTISKIAKKYNVTIETLSSLNKMTNIDFITVGQKIIIP